MSAVVVYTLPSLAHSHTNFPRRTAAGRKEGGGPTGAALSALAGYVTASLQGAPDAMMAVKTLAGVNLTIGVLVEVMYWSLMPVWYHVIFLALIVPMTFVGGFRKASMA